MSNLNNNTTQLEALLAKVNALPEAGGTDTSDTTATADEIFAGETAYTADGKVTGTFTIEEELTEQNDLISQIATLVATKANPQGSTEDLNSVITELETKVATLNTELEGKASGGGATTVSVTVQNGTNNNVYYWDSSQQIQTVGAGTTETVNVLNGVLAYQQVLATVCSGSFLRQAIFGIHIFMFLSDGGIMTCYTESGGSTS